MLEKMYECSEGHDVTKFRIHSTIPEPKELYAIRAYKVKDSVELETRLVLFWALVEWRKDIDSSVTYQDVVPVFTVWNNTGRAVEVAQDDNIMGYATKTQLENDKDSCSWKSWQVAAVGHLEEIGKRQKKVNIPIPKK